MIMLNKKIKHKEYEAEVIRRKQGIEDARDERELRESQDQRQNSFVVFFVLFLSEGFTVFVL